MGSEKDLTDLSAFSDAGVRYCSAAQHPWQYHSEQSHPSVGSMKVWRLLMAPVRPSRGIFHFQQQPLVPELLLVPSMCFPSPWPSRRAVMDLLRFHKQEKCLKKGMLQMWQLCSHQSNHNHRQDLAATSFCSSATPALSALSPRVARSGTLWRLQ